MLEDSVHVSTLRISIDDDHTVAVGARGSHGGGVWDTYTIAAGAESRYVHSGTVVPQFELSLTEAQARKVYERLGELLGLGTVSQVSP